MPIVCGVRFRGTCKAYYFSPGDLDIRLNDYVIVETARGKEMGQVALPTQEIEESKIVGQLKPILRRATTADLLEAQHYQRQEAEAAQKCREQVVQFNLPMKVVSAEYNYDGSRITFFFTSEQRVDFRELVRELARTFKTRIELRQIGVRDEAKSIGGYGKCGRPLCCATWLTDFNPVSIRMAKQQDLPLSPMEISGLCGRLLCCLGYENSFYDETKSKFPKVGKTVETPLGPAKIIGIDVFEETTRALLEDGTIYELTVDQLEGREPIEVKKTKGTDTWNGAQSRALEAALPSDGAEPGARDSDRLADDSAQQERARRKGRPNEGQPQGGRPQGGQLRGGQPPRSRNSQDSREPKGGETPVEADLSNRRSRRGGRSPRSQGGGAETKQDPRSPVISTGGSPEGQTQRRRRNRPSRKPKNKDASQ